jgi:ZIP family zinc transporter
VSLLVLDAVAPVLGALVAGMIALDSRFIGVQLAFFAGFLLYLGASDLLPSVHLRPRRGLVASTIAGLVTSGALVFALDKAL